MEHRRKFTRAVVGPILGGDFLTEHWGGQIFLPTSRLASLSIAFVPLEIKGGMGQRLDGERFDLAGLSSSAYSLVALQMAAFFLLAAGPPSSLCGSSWPRLGGRHRRFVMWETRRKSPGLNINLFRLQPHSPLSNLAAIDAITARPGGRAGLGFILCLSPFTLQT